MRNGRGANQHGAKVERLLADACLPSGKPVWARKELNRVGPPDDMWDLLPPALTPGHGRL